MYLLSGLCFSLLILITLLEILLRNLFGINHSWYYEIIGIISGIAIIVSFISAEKDSSHIRVTLFKYKYSKVIRILLTLLVYIFLFLGQIFGCFISFSMEYKTIMLGIPEFIFQMICSMCFGYLIFILIRRFFIR